MSGLGETDTIYAFDAAAMTDALTAPVEVSAADSSGPATTCELRGVQPSESSRSRDLARTWRLETWGSCTSLWRTESSGSGVQPGKKRSESVPVGTKRPSEVLDSLDPPD